MPPTRRYRNPWPGSIEHGPSALFRWMAERRRNPPPPDPPASSFDVAVPEFVRPRAAPGELTVTWVGHATTIVQMGALNILTDPVWSERASPIRFAGPRRRVAPAVAFDELPPIDVVLLSHDHYDHLDRRTIRRLIRRSPDARWAAPVGAGRHVRRLGATAVGEHGWWDREAVDDLGFEVVCTPARHFSGRTPWSRNRSLWCGWAIRAKGASVFFAGDTALHPEFGDIAKRCGPFDLTILPIGAYSPSWMMQPVHMNPEEAVKAYGEIAGVHRERGWPRPAMLPIHWGTFKLSDEPLDEPPRRLTAAWAGAGHDRDALWLLCHGETRRRSGGC